MLALYMVGGLLALILLVLCIPVTFRVAYDDRLTVAVRILGFRKLLSPAAPAKKEEKKPKTARKPKTPETEKKKRTSVFGDLADALKENGVVGTLRFLSEVLAILRRAAGRLVRSVTVSRFALRLEIAGEDAAQTALTYGRVCAALYPLLGMIDSLVRIRRQDVTVCPAFLEEKHRATIDIRGHICPLRVVWAALCAMASLMVSVVKVRSNEKYISKEVANHG